MSHVSPITFRSATNDLVGRRHLPGYRLVDNEGGIWEFELEQGSTRRFLAFIKVPTKYKPMLGLNTAVKMFNEIEKEALKAIDRYNLTKGLKGSAKDTWNDILEFKQYFEESNRIDPKMLEIEDITDQDLFGDDVVQAWLIIQHFNNGEVQYYLTLNDQGDYFLCDMEGDEASPYYTEPFIKAVKNWEIKKGLKGDAKDTWEDILESKEYEKEATRMAPENVSIQVVGINREKPEQGYDMYDLLLNGEKAQFVFYPNDKEKSLLHYYPDWMCNKLPEFGEDEHGNEVVNAEVWEIDDYWSRRGPVRDTLRKRIVNAIVSHGLKGSAKETWSDILEFKDYFQD
jgi:hypothetical protein